MADLHNGFQRPVPLNGELDMHPLRDAVLCCTSVPDEKRTKMAEMAKQMGADIQYDLTSDVTHLIIGDYNTPKYKYVAKERPDVKPMTMEWVEAVRDQWVEDEQIEIEGLEKQYTLPTLHGLRLSMTGCDDPAERMEIAESVKANGGSYEGDLTKQITHLISFRTEGAKYKAAKTWGLKIVAIEWLRDSLERGMILDHTLYDPTLPIEERGKGAWDRNKRRISLGKRYRGEISAGLNLDKRKLRRTASTKLSTGHDEMWEDIMGGVPQVMRSGVWGTADEPETATTATTDATEALRNEAAQYDSMKSDGCAPTQDIGGIFSSCRFFLDGFESRNHQILCDFMVPEGADLCCSMVELAKSTQGTVRLFRVISSSAYGPDPEPGVEVVNEWWVERCIYNKAFLEPSVNVLGRPFPKFPITGFSELIISSAAFSGMELKQVKQAVELIGAKYSEEFTSHSSLLVTKVVAHLRKDKSELAAECNIPILNAEWLWDSITAGEKLSFTNYLFRKVRRSDSLPAKSRPAKQDSKLRSKSDQAKILSKPASSSSISSKPPRMSRLDTSAFEDDGPAVPSIKPEDSSQAQLPPRVPKTSFSTLKTADSESNTTDITSSLTDLSKTPTLPFTERSHNSPTRTTSTDSAHSEKQPPRPSIDPDISLNISNLLAKTKRSAPTAAEFSDRRRGGRILGRVTSNMSSTSVNSSTGTPDSNIDLAKPASPPTVEQFLDAGNDRRIQQDVDSQPPATQLNYDDPVSAEYKETIMARMKGEKVEGRKPLTKEKNITLGDISGAGAAGRKSKRRPAGFR